MTELGITVFLNGEEVTTGDYSVTCRQERERTLGKHEGDGAKARVELDVEITNCHTDLTEGKVSVSLFSAVFDGIISDRTTTMFATKENRPNLHNFTVILVPKPQHYIG